VVRGVRAAASALRTSWSVSTLQEQTIMEFRRFQANEFQHR
jgi:hypothetical protein